MFSEITGYSSSRPMSIFGDVHIILPPTTESGRLHPRGHFQWYHKKVSLIVKIKVMRRMSRFAALEVVVVEWPENQEMVCLN